MVHSEILYYLSSQLASTLAVLPNLIAWWLPLLLSSSCNWKNICPARLLPNRRGLVVGAQPYLSEEAWSSSAD